LYRVRELTGCRLSRPLWGRDNICVVAAGGKTPDISSERRSFIDVMTENKLKATQVSVIYIAIHLCACASSTVWERGELDGQRPGRTWQFASHRVYSTQSFFSICNSIGNRNYTLSVKNNDITANDNDLVLPSWHSHFKSSLSSFDECRLTTK